MQKSILIAIVLLLLTTPLVGTIWTEAAFPGANGKIVFHSNRDTFFGAHELYVMDPDGTNITRLTTNSVGENAPAWSPDGSRIAYRAEVGADEEIFVMNADGTGQTNVTNSPSSPDRYPSWSPDGTRIAFQSYRAGGDRVYVMNADGSFQHRLTTSSSTEIMPAWSPDGGKIAFSSNSDGNYEVYVVNADGSGTPSRLTDQPGSDRYAAWSPDGTKIAFASERTGNHEIYVMNADGTNQTNLTNNPAADLIPAWSPDATKLAFTSDRQGTTQIYVMNADGSGAPERLTSAGQASSSPDWQPIPMASIASAQPTTLTEASADDGSLAAGTVTLTIASGVLAANIARPDITAANLPAGMDYTITRTDGTHLTIAITGQATSHTDADDVNNLTFTIARARVTGATSDLTSAAITIDFASPAPEPTPVPTAIPTAIPSPVPTSVPTAAPSPVPTSLPTAVPSPTATSTPPPPDVPEPGSLILLASGLASLGGLAAFRARFRR